MKIKKKYLIEKIYSIIILMLLINVSLAEYKIDEDLDVINLIISKHIIVEVEDVYNPESILDFALNSLLMEKYNWLGIKNIKTEILFSIDKVIERIKQNEADLIGVSILDYLRYESELEMTPIFIVQRGVNSGTEYIVLTKRDSQINSLSDLKGKKVLTYSGEQYEELHYWLFVEMKKEKIKNPNTIINSFSKISEARKRVFSVFFDKADACIVSKAQFESLSELNPQLKNRIKILYKSPSYLTNVFCRNNRSTKSGLVQTEDFIRKFNKSESGNQMLKLFKLNKIEIFKNEYLETSRKLFLEYNIYSTK